MEIHLITFSEKYFSLQEKYQWSTQAEILVEEITEQVD